jgi:hypothetical protein
MSVKSYYLSFLVTKGHKCFLQGPHVGQHWHMSLDVPAHAGLLRNKVTMLWGNMKETPPITA